MRRVVTGGLVVNGDGESLLDGQDVLIVDGRVERIGFHVAEASDEVVDARDCVVLPGLVNVHTHGVTGGPLMPSGGLPLPRWKWMNNLDRHLLQGTTAVLNLCGFATMEKVKEADRAHPIHVAGATTHEPNAIRAAIAADGAGMSRPDIIGTSVGEQIAQGAVAIGELGGGQTLAGGGQDLVYLPAAFLRRHGARVGAEQARELKEAVLGRRLEWIGATNSSATLERVAVVLTRMSLDARLGPEDVVSVVCDTVLPSLGPALKGIREGVRLAQKHGVPAFVHSAAATAGLLTKLADDRTMGSARIVASHVNHTSHSPDEALTLARLGKAVGWTNEACVFDLISGREMIETREQWDVLFDSDESLVDVVGTDYGPDGRHDGLLEVVRDLTESGRMSLPQAVALVSSAPADLVPGLTPARGRIALGLPADLVIVDRADLTRVRHVLIGGRVVVNGGLISAVAQPPVLDADQFATLESAVGTDLALRDELDVADSLRGLKRGLKELGRWMESD